MTVVYFDASALVKLVVEEIGSEVATALWDAADVVVTSRLAYPEVRAALASAFRDGRLSAEDQPLATQDWEGYWSRLRIVEATSVVASLAGDVAEQFALRGYDAVHLASVLVLDDPQVIVAAWDHRLRRSVRAARLRIAPSKL